MDVQRSNRPLSWLTLRADVGLRLGDAGHTALHLAAMHENPDITRAECVQSCSFFFWMGQRAEIKNATQQNPPKRLGGAMSGRRQAHVKRGPFSQALTERLLQHLDCRALSHQSGAKIPQTDRRVVRSQRNGPRAPRVRTDRSRPVTIDKQVAVCRICRKQSAVPTHHALKTTPRKSHSLAKTQIQQR